MKNKLLIITFVLSTFLCSFVPVSAASSFLTISEVKSRAGKSPLEKQTSTKYKYWLRIEGFVKNSDYYNTQVYFSDYPIIITERRTDGTILLKPSNKNGMIIDDDYVLYAILTKDGLYECSGQYTHGFQEKNFETASKSSNSWISYTFNSPKITANHSVIDNTDPTKPFFRAPLLTQETFVSLQERVAQALAVIIGGTISLVGLAVLLVVLVRHLRTLQRA